MKAKVKTVLVDTALTLSDSGSVVFMSDAPNATVHVTLPAVADGLWFCFICPTWGAGGLEVAPQAGEQILLLPGTTSGHLANASGRPLVLIGLAGFWAPDQAINAIETDWRNVD